MTEPGEPDPASEPLTAGLPPRDGDMPLHAFARDPLSAFLLAAFSGDELLKLCREARVATQGGYRLEALDDAARADLLGDELRAVPQARGPVLALLRELYEFPALDAVVLPKEVAAEVAELAVQPDAPVRMLWRLMADPSAEIRAVAAQGLELLADEMFGEPEPVDGEAAPAAAQAQDPDAVELRKEARRAGAQAERAQGRVAALKTQLRAARAEVQAAQRDARQAERRAAKAEAELLRTQDRLEKAREKARSDALEKAEKALRDAGARASHLEQKLAAQAEARTALERELAAAQRSHAEVERKPEPAAAADEPEPVPTTWLLPRFSREFYDSLERWDLRIQRTAFKQAHLLAENHRHPSLRAIPLEGLPGYYRVRIATDVRLIYRRAESDRCVEILSLIDREDLDRYVRQAKTR